LLLPSNYAAERKIKNMNMVEYHSELLQERVSDRRDKHMSGKRLVAVGVNAIEKSFQRSMVGLLQQFFKLSQVFFLRGAHAPCHLQQNKSWSKQYTRFSRLITMRWPLFSDK